ncbi:branched-chain amino acid ABC transporter permease [Hydrogenophaga sp. SNF1]|uniref:Branched-chain amino acid ABC transporter permease n=1 Tax=Hydrogenophaga borbori TaxID=2294117 RepID=A0A372EPC1_9BURK|nr:MULTISPECIES: branched-chain amino acid ABC transporter permease [Hydrogenophaga]RFP82479.1 branched-chain amino acid ABC transporter permease [Hydrogenophaga borbori]WQB82055.1 branched-chain amino acid ABC transporter permease [Hydrogenophaga sp. SNF1]
MSTAKAQLEKLPRSIQFVLALGAIALAAFPLLPVEGGDFYLGMLSQMMILAIFAMSLDLLQGVTGLVSLGHAAFFGLAGYALAFVTPQDAPIALWWSLPLAAAAAGLAALVIGFFVVRTHGIYFIMVTMAFAQMVYFLFFDNKALGGSDGIYVTFRPDATALGIDLDNKLVFYYFTLAVLLALYFALRRLLFSPFGRVLAGIRVNEHRMRAVGYGTFGYKLTAFTLAGALAGVAGYLWAAQTGFVNPELMGFHMSAHAIMMVILGGMGNFAGAIVGAFAFEYVMHVFKDLTKHWQLLMGGFIVLVVIVAPRGLLGLVERFTQRGGKS